MMLNQGKCLLPCIACSNHTTTARSSHNDDAENTPGRKPPSNSLTAQIREMASGAYNNCKPCMGVSVPKSSYSEDACSYKRTTDEVGCSIAKLWGKEMRVRVMASETGELRSPASRPSDSTSCVAENKSNEWVAHVEPGVLINFVSMTEGGNELRKIRFSRDMFNKLQAQQWWTQNYDKVIELYNVQKFNRQTVPLQTPRESEDGVSNVPSVRCGPMTPPISNERLLSSTRHSKCGDDSSSDSPNHDSMQTPKLSSISGSRIESSPVDVSARSSSSYETDHSGQLSVSNASDLETEWVEQDEPGVYITIRELAGGIRELRRVRFSRETFREMHARLWWEENRARIQEQYL